MTVILVLCTIGFFCLISAIFISHDQASDRPPTNYLSSDIYEKLDHYKLNAECADNVGTAKRNVSKIQDIRYEAEATGESEKVIQCIKKYESNAEKALLDIAREEWMEAADEIIDELIECYDFVVSTKPDSYNFAELKKAKDNALTLYENLMWLRIPDVFVGIRPHEYIKEYLGDRYAPCMNSRWELGKHLDTIIDSAKPEKKRGEKLKREIVKYVRSNTSVKRSALKKIVFDGFSQKETEYAYKSLIKSNKLAEYKVGNFYFVCVVDKQKKPAEINSTGSEIEIPVTADLPD